MGFSSGGRLPKTLAGATINWAHPLANGLVGYWAINEGAGERLNNLANLGREDMLREATVPIWGSNGLIFDGAATKVSLGVAVRSTVPLSIASRGMLTNATGSKAMFAMGQTVGGTGALCLVGWDGTSNMRYQVRGTSGGTLATLNLGGTALLQDATVVGTSNGLSEHAAFLNGKPPVTSATTISAPNWNRTTIGFLRRSADSDYWVGPVYWAGVWLRQLTQADAAWLHAEPYALLHQVRSRRFFVPAAAGGDVYSGRGIGRGVARGVYR